MCIVSAVGERWNPPQEWKPSPQPVRFPATPNQLPERIERLIPVTSPKDATLEDIQNFIKAIELAREYDIENDEPECADAAKLSFIEVLNKKLAKMLLKAAQETDIFTVGKIVEALEALEVIETYI